jgi:hypothetical protein
MRITARRKGRVMDQTSVRFGFSTIRFDAEKRF